jgi:hypothetical protein
MTPELRAIIDRFMYEQATVTYIVMSLPPGGVERVMEGPGWTVRQLIAHFAGTQEGYAAATERWLAGQPALPDDFDTGRINAMTATANIETPLADLLARLRRSLRALFAAFHQVPDGDLEAPFAGHTAIETFRSWGRHYRDHAFDLLDAAPELRFEPLVLNWILYAEFTDEGAQARQRALVEEVREHYAAMPDEDVEEGV